MNEISLDTIKGDADANTNITFAGSDVTTFTQGGQERLRLNTTGAQVTGNIVVSGTVDGRDVAADGVTADAALSRAGGAMGGAITTNSTFDGRDVSVDGTKLDGIESGATADQTDVEIRAAVESASDSNVFTNADHSKLDAIEASADVTDATNVTAAGALMRAGGTMTGGLSGTTASFSSTVSASEYDLPSGGMLDWANGDARIVEGLVNNYSLSFQTYDGSTASTALRLDGNNAATFAGTISSGAISATGSANSGSASHLPAFLASGNYGGGIATRDTKESGWYQQTNGADWHFYHNRTVASDTPTSKIVLSFNSSGNATFAGTISSGAITSTSSMNAAGGYYVSGTEVIDASRNLTSIGNITTAGSTSIQTAGTNTNMTIGTSVSGSTGLLKLISTGDIQLYQYGTSWSTNVTFKGDGNVGIGTPTPYGLTHWQKSSTVNLVATNTGADGQADTTVMSLIGQARGYSNNLSKLASIDFKTDPTTWYYGAITFNVANLDGTDTSRTPLEAMRINRLGNVGIGTTAPEKNLSIGSSQAEGIQFNFDTTNNYRNQILNYWNSSADSRMDFNVARASGATPSTIMSVGHNSNVGIGTTSPTSKLEVIVTQSDTMTDDTAAFAIKGNGSDGILMGQRATAPYAAWIAAGYLPNIGTSHNYPLALQPHGGSVGIGTTSPAQALQVNGNIRINHPDTGSAPGMTAQLQIYGYEGRGAGIKIRDSVNSAASANNREWFIGSGYAQDGFNIGYASDGSQSSYAAQNKLTITTDGKVGIGTPAPSYPLHIQTNDGTTNSTVGNILITNLSTGTTVPGFGGHIQFQAERNNGVNQNIGKIAFQSEVNAGTNISAGLRLYTSSAGTMTEKGRISWDGMWFVNGVRNYYQKITISNNQSYTFDVPIHSTGNGHTVYYECMYNHFGNDTYGARRMGFFSFRSLSNSTSADHVVHNGGNATNAGAWSVSMVGAGTSTPRMRFTKSAGSYSGTGQGYIHVRGGLPV